jgi:hypothetical protein
MTDENRYRSKNIQVFDDLTQRSLKINTDRSIDVKIKSGDNELSINESGQAHVVLRGDVDNNNSSTDTLLKNVSFTGEACEILDYAIININVFSDVASATDGLSIQQSSDGTNWDVTDDYTVPGNTGKTYSIQTAAKYFRIVYTNGGSDQGVFRLQTLLKKTNTKPSSHRIQDPIIDDDDAELSKAVLTGKDPDDVYRNVNTTVDGDLKISDNSSGLAIAKGDVTGNTFIHKFGNAPDFDTGDGEVTVWDGANDGDTGNAMNYTYSTSADIDSISSSNNGDTQDIEIQGLDSNYDLVTQTITLTGQTRKALDTSLIRIFRMKNVGSTDLTGYVYCYVNTAINLGKPVDQTKIRAIIDNGNNQTEMAIYTIPNGKTGYMRDWYASSAGAVRTTNYIMRLKAKPFGQVFQLKHRAAIGEAVPYKHPFTEPEVFAAKTDIEMTAETTATGISASAVAAGFDIVLIDN